jgi:hypothetical protein
MNEKAYRHVVRNHRTIDVNGRSICSYCAGRAMLTYRWSAGGSWHYVICPCHACDPVKYDKECARLNLRLRTSPDHRSDSPSSESIVVPLIAQATRPHGIDVETLNQIPMDREIEMETPPEPSQRTTEEEL